MRRVIAAVFAALMLSTAAEARVLVVQGKAGTGGTAELQMAECMRVVNGILTSWGVDYDVIPYSAAKTEFCRLGRQTWSFNGSTGSHTTSYDFVIHAGWWVGQNDPLSATYYGYYPDSLTLAVRWPLVPQIYIGAPVVPSGKFTDVGTGAYRCTTGVRSNNGASALNYLMRANYTVGSTEVWRTAGAHHVTAFAAPRPGGILRTVVGTGSANLNNFNCTNCDGLTRFANADTAALWARYRSAGDAAPLIFCNYTQVTGSADDMLVAAAIAMADSITGKRNIQRPIRMAVVVNSWFKTGNYSAFWNNDTVFTGVFCRSDSCDTLNVAATMDSLNSLGIPITFGCEIDSIPTLTYQDRLMRRVTRFHVTPQVWKGTTLGPTGAGNATALSLNDIFGHNRTRTLRPLGQTGYDFTCSATDSSVGCLLRSAFSRLEALYPGRVDRSIHAAFDDWSPRFISRTRADSLGELMRVFHGMGVRNLRVAVMDPSSEVGQVEGGLAPRGWSTANQRYPIRQTPGTQSPVVGYIRQIPSRGMEARTAAGKHYYDGAHDPRMEEIHGRFSGSWYLPHELMYVNRHAFFAKTEIISVGASMLGGAGDGTNPGRSAWWHIKWTANEFSTVNRLAGRTVAALVYPEDL